jgi:tetratricopeptide (TPR) repeat protein
MLSTVSWQWFRREDAVRRKARRLSTAKFNRIAALIAVVLLIAVVAWQFTPLPEMLGLSLVLSPAPEKEQIEPPPPEEKKAVEPVIVKKQEAKKPKPEPEKKAPPQPEEKTVSKEETVDVSSKVDRGIQLFNQGNFDECIKQMEEVLKLDPENSSALYFISEAKKKISEQAKEQEIRDKLKSAQDAFRRGEYQESVDQVRKILESDPENAQARRLMNQMRQRAAHQQAEALVNGYVQSIQSKNLMAFYEKACDPRLSEKLRQRTESSMKMFESFESTASDINIQFKGLAQAEISFNNVITGVSKSGTKQKLYDGPVRWRVRRESNDWKIINIISTPREKRRK